MRVLGIDTSTWTASVAVVEGSCARAERTQSAVASHGFSLLPLILETLGAAGLTLRDLDAVAVSIGPGSFTGLRIALSTAKGIAFARGIAIVAVPTLHALAEVAEAPAGMLVCPLLDARKQEVYTALFRAEPSGLRCLVAETAVPLEPWLRGIDGPCLFLGDAVELLPEWVVRREGWRVLPFSKFHPRGSVIARRGGERLERGEADDLIELEPFYVRPSEAELNAP